MGQKLGPEFWEWAWGKGFPPRAARGDVQNFHRMRLMLPLINEWRKLQKEKAREQSTAMG